MGFQTSENVLSNGPVYEYGQTPFTIRSATHCKTSKGNDMLKIIFDITDAVRRSGKFTTVIFDNEHVKYKCFLECIGKTELIGKEVDGSIFNGCQGVFLMGWNCAKGFHEVDAWLPFDKDRNTYNRYNDAVVQSNSKNDGADISAVGVIHGLNLDDIPL